MEKDWQASKNQALYQALFEQSDDAILLADLEGRCLAANPRATQLLGYAPAELIGLDLQVLSAEVGETQETLAQLAAGEEMPPYERQLRKKNGEIIYVEPRLTLIRDQDGQPYRILGIVREISQRKRREQALYLMLETQQQLTRLESIPEIYQLVGTKVQALTGDGFVVTSELDEGIQAMWINGLYGFGKLYESLVQRFNIAPPHRMLYPLSKMTPEELATYRSGKLEQFRGGLYALLLRRVPQAICELVEKQMKVSAIYTMSFIWHGTHFGGITLLARSPIDPYIEMIEAIMHQASLALKRLISEEKLHQSEKHYRQTLDHMLEGCQIIGFDWRYLYVNAAAARHGKQTPEALLGHTMMEIYPGIEATEMFATLEGVMQTRQPAQLENHFTYPDGSRRWFELSVQPVSEGIFILSIDITNRKQAAQALAQSEQRFRALTEHAPDSIVIFGVSGRIEYASPSIFYIMGYTPEQIVGLDPTTITHPEDLPALESELNQLLQTPGKTIQTQYRMRHKDGSWRWLESNISNFMGVPDIQGLVFNYHDITDRRRAEQALGENQKRLSGIIHSAMDAIISLDAQQRVIIFNPAAEHMFRCRTAEVMGQTIERFIPLQFRQRHFGHIDQFGKTGQTHRFMGSLGPLTCLRADGEEFPAEITISQTRMGGEKIYTAVLRDITERLRAEKELRHRTNETRALLTAALALSSLDLDATLQTIGHYAKSLFLAEGCRIFLVDAEGQSLRCVLSLQDNAENEAYPDVKLKRGEGLIGSILASGEAEIVNERQKDPRFVPLPGDEVGEANMFAPLTERGVTIGVISVRRLAGDEPFKLDDLGLLKAFASLAASAVSNAHLFAETQRSNAELRQAYNTTIEGWSRALDLRDKETEGHTQRVTDLALKLARRMQIPETELIHIRRGALLHDIGKMGVPDSILLKPGELNEAEWEIMRQHPVYAYELLAPIQYLQPALDIPYCHHEHWDGNGYPRGLKGDQIPLAARIFAVIDVWDALCNNRPYRPAWPQEAVIAHLKAGSGTHFDPQVVRAFLELIASGG